MEVHFKFPDVPQFAAAMKFSAPEKLVRAIGSAFYRIGKSDIAKMRSEQLQGGSLKIKAKRFLNSFKFKATDSRGKTSLDQLSLHEYTGAKPFKIFETGGEIGPKKGRTLMVLTDEGKKIGGLKRADTIHRMLDEGSAQIIQTRAGPAIIKLAVAGKAGYRKGARMVILAWLKPRVKEKKRIDFFRNFDSNENTHRGILIDAADEMIARTLEGMGGH